MIPNATITPSQVAHMVYWSAYRDITEVIHQHVVNVLHQGLGGSALEIARFQLLMAVWNGCPRLPVLRETKDHLRRLIRSPE